MSSVNSQVQPEILRKLKEEEIILHYIDEEQERENHVVIISPQGYFIFYHFDHMEEVFDET